MNPPNPLLAMAMQALASKGRNGDSMLAHINPREAAMLQQKGGAGTVNPRTGLREFYDDGGADGDPEGYGGNDDTGTDANAAAAAAANAPSQGTTGFGPPNPNTHDAQSVNPNAAPGPTLDPNANNQGFVDTNAAMQAATPAPGVNGVVGDGWTEKAMAKGINGLFGMAPFGLGALNTVSGALGGPTVAGVLMEHGDKNAVGTGQDVNGNTTDPSFQAGGFDGAGFTGAGGFTGYGSFPPLPGANQ